MKLCIVALCVCAALVARGQETLSDVHKELNEFYDKTHPADVAFAFQALSTEEKARFIAFTRQQFREKAIGRDEYLQRLYYLGDIEARDALVKEYFRDAVQGQAHRQGSLFAAAGDPAVIPMLAPALLRQEPFYRAGDDAFSYPMSFDTARIIIAIVRNSPAFSSDVLNWARAFPSNDTPPDEQLRTIVREWWYANELHFREGNYKAVQPGRARASERVANVSDGANLASTVRIAPNSTRAGGSERVGSERAPTWSWSVLSLAFIVVVMLGGLMLWRDRRG